MTRYDILHEKESLIEVEENKSIPLNQRLNQIDMFFRFFL